MSDHATVVGLSGYAQSGKDTFASILVADYGFERIAFADALRDCLYALNPVLDINHYDGIVRLQGVVDRAGWDHAKLRPEVRTLLQRMGTEVGREIIDPDLWVKLGIAKVGLVGRFVFTDMRFPNEYNAIVNRGGHAVRVERPGTTPVNAHPSETALDKHTFGFTVHNVAGLDLLETEAYRLAIRLGLA